MIRYSRSAGFTPYSAAIFRASAGTTLVGRGFGVAKRANRRRRRGIPMRFGVRMGEHFGRIGYIIQGFGDGKTTTGRKEIRCMGCRVWFAEAGCCPECGWERPGFNKQIRTNQLNRNLFEYAGTAAAQPSTAPVSSDVKPPKGW